MRTRLGEAKSEDEAAFKLLRRSGNDEGVLSEDLAVIIADFLALSALRDPQGRRATPAQDLRFRDNRSFWASAHRLHEGATVILENFAVTEWAPAAPGRYHTPAATQARRRALQFRDPSRPEYLPLGKMNMVLGGVGSVRLASISVAGERTHFLGVTSTGISHEGIPLCVGRNLYKEIVPHLKENGACDCTIVGTVELLPETLEAIDYALGIPRLMVRAEDVTIVRPARTEGTRISLSILYMGAAREYETSYKTSKNVGWTFASFDPCIGQPERELKGTVDWLREYASRHSALDNPPVVCDFDQHIRHFGDEVLFRLDEVVKGGVDIELLGRFIRNQRLNINIEQVGDRFENVVNSEITNRSTLIRE